MNPINLLFSTTRQWNPGDEFILFGIRNLLSKVGVQYNPVIYNRHPSINPQKTVRKLIFKKRKIPHLDNSFMLDNDQLIDYVIFAGTPEWFGGIRINPLLNFIERNHIRCAFLGVGVHKQHEFSEILKRVFEKQTDLIVARDQQCFDLVKGFPNSYYEVCPAMFSARSFRQRGKLNRIGVVIQADKIKHHELDHETFDYCLKQYAQLEKKYNVSYIAHYIDDLKLAKGMDKDVFYSAYSEDYVNIYDQFDLIVSTRVHGCGLASSLGIPNILIPHDGRYQTAVKFQSLIADRGQELSGMIEKVDIAQKSSEIIKFRIESELRYLDFLRTHLSFLGRNK